MEKQIERIKEMETCLDKVLAATNQLREALDEYEAVVPQYLKLSGYYGSAAWREDFEADEAGEIPRDLKRGVLSEDAVYDLLQDTRLMKGKMLGILDRIVE